MNAAPPVQGLAAFALERGLVTMADARSHIHAGLRSAPPTKRFRRWYEAETRRLLAEAGETARLYREQIEAGAVIAPPPPTLEQIADGHPDLASTQAARRVIEKRRVRRALAEAARLPYDAACARCLHWTPPSEREESDFRHWQMTGRGRRVKEPSGHCFRVMHRPGGPTAFAATMGRNRCFNFEKKPDPAPDRRRGKGFVTIWKGDKILWQGTEGEEPAEFRQAELDL